MKIVHLIAHLELGGAEVFVSNLIKYQVSKDIKFELWCLEKSKNIEFETRVIDELKKYDINVIILTKTKNRSKRVWEIIKNIKRFSPDIINTHLLHVTGYGILGKIFSFNKRIKIVETIHNTKLGNKTIHNLVSNYFTEKTIAITEKVKENLINEANIKSEKIVIIENGIETVSKEFKVREEVKKIIAVGRLTDQKNHIFLLKAYKKIKENLKKVPLLEIYGEGELRTQLQDYINENNLQDDVKLKGLTLNIKDKLFESDIYVLVSKYEGLSISLLEALTIGIPIIATKAQGIEDIITTKKINLVELENQQKLQDEIILLIKNLTIRKMNSKELIKLSKRYLIENKAVEYNNLYKKILIQRDSNDLYF